MAATQKHLTTTISSFQELREKGALYVTEDLEEGMGADALSSFDVAELSQAKGDMDKVQAFLLQTGYLTIESGNESMLMLRFPNAEVRNAYSKSLLRRLYGPTSQNVIMAMENKLKEGVRPRAWSCPRSSRRYRTRRRGRNRTSRRSWTPWWRRWAWKCGWQARTGRARGGSTLRWRRAGMGT